MKNFLFLILLSYSLTACESDRTYNFSMKRTIIIRLGEDPATKTLKIDSITYLFNHRTFDELRAEENEFTYSKWYQAGDTMWFCKRVLNVYNQLETRGFIYHAGPTFVVMVNHGVIYYCP
jgi:hypothetical protein